MTNELENQHPDFKVIPLSDGYEIWLIDVKNGALLEAFGKYKRFEKAEESAYRFQQWLEAERW